MKHTVIDWMAMGCPIGTMVCRSEFCMREKCMKGKPQIGIITNFKHFADSRGIVITWPVVAWEGCRTGDSINHPANVDIYRKKEKKNAKYRDMME